MKQEEGGDGDAYGNFVYHNDNLCLRLADLPGYYDGADQVSVG